MAAASTAAGAATFLVTGCSRGIGLEWVRQILARGDSIVATCRNPAGAAELQTMLDGYSGTGFAHALPVDVSDEASVSALPALLAEKGVAAIDVLVHNAGISAPTHPVDPAIGATKAALMACYETNAVGPLLLTQALLPLVAASSMKKVLVVSSMMGSLEKTGLSGGSVSYRASKAGANMITLCMAGELGESHGLTFAMVHPGWVATRDTNSGEPRGLTGGPLGFASA